MQSKETAIYMTPELRAIIERHVQETGRPLLLKTVQMNNTSGVNHAERNKADESAKKIGEASAIVDEMFEMNDMARDLVGSILEKISAVAKGLAQLDENLVDVNTLITNGDLDGAERKSAETPDHVLECVGGLAALARRLQDGDNTALAEVLEVIDEFLNEPKVEEARNDYGSEEPQNYSYLAETIDEDAGFNEPQGSVAECGCFSCVIARAVRDSKVRA